MFSATVSAGASLSSWKIMRTPSDRAVTGSSAACVAGRCAFVCRAPFADCDLRPENGCEADTSPLGRCPGV